MNPFAIFMAVASMAQTMMGAQQQQKAQRQAAQQAADRAAKERWEAYEQAEKKRKEDLKRNLAKRRARMGASGLSSVDGSAGAIIQGLRNDKAEATHEDFSDAEEGIAQHVSDIHANLLESSKQSQRSLFKDVGGKVASIGGSLLDQAPKPDPELTRKLPNQLYDF